jgi:D-alanyl-D-alanine carboxypeptidase/D-alanyl-D-alanine-endopeptidase (penicillin-binding protein 4)
MKGARELVLVAAGLLAAAASASADDHGLVWHAETLGGDVLSSHLGDRPVNPASVTKIATSLFAIETLGADHRYDTGFALGGSLDPATGVLHGDLVVRGGGDPDFQFENALLVAWRLNELGVRDVEGDLVVDDSFWIGWEHGSEMREPDPAKRRNEMGERLRRAFDPRRWDANSKESWRGWQERDPSLAPEPPRLSIAGRVRARTTGNEPPTLVHRSNPLRTILKRFLTYSNNDIERVADPLGGAPALESYLRKRFALAADELRISTTSGLGINRFAPATIVRILHAFRERIAQAGLQPGDLLPVPGCDPGSLVHALPHWQSGARAGAMASKTGTLIHDDGGVAALAGFVYGESGTVVYMVAAPRSGSRIRQAQQDIETWVNEIVARVSGPAPRPCGAPVEPAEAEAEILASGPEVAPRHAASPS